MTKNVCPFCLNRTFGIRWDKRLHPFFSCSMCGHKIFVRNTLAISSVFAWTQTLEQLDVEKLRGLILAGSNTLEARKKESPEMQQWSQTEEALGVTPENRRI